MSCPEFELPPWSEEHELRINEESAEHSRRSERVAEINSRGCDPEYLPRWYDGQPIDVKIAIQKKNIFDCKLAGFGNGVRYFQAKLAALLQEKERVDSRGCGTGNGGGGEALEQAVPNAGHA